MQLYRLSITRRAYLGFFIVTLFLSGCSTSTTKKEVVQKPQPEALRIRVKAGVGSPTGVNGNGPTIDKNLFNIAISPGFISINTIQVKDINAVEALLKKYPNPVITISSHKCTDAKFATKIMSLAQNHTDTPIPFGSFGAFDDPECK